jgi:hypothetical protein
MRRTRLESTGAARGRVALVGWAALWSVALAMPAGAQVRSVDPDHAIDGDLASPVAPPPAASGPDEMAPDPRPAPVTADAPPPARDSGALRASTTDGSETYHEDDLIGAAEGAFGKGAKGIAGVIEGILKKQGEPNGYIVGREGGGAFVVGLRYGSGTLHHKVEGMRPVYWTGPSVGFDAGAAAGSAFVLVYNLYDTQNLFQRFPAGEGQAYFVGGFNVSYLRAGDVVLVPVRLGVGLRLGVNAGYMKFSQKQNWVPF